MSNTQRVARVPETAAETAPLTAGERERLSSDPRLRDHLVVELVDDDRLLGRLRLARWLAQRDRLKDR